MRLKLREARAVPGGFEPLDLKQIDSLRGLKLYVLTEIELKKLCQEVESEIIRNGTFDFKALMRRLI